MHHPRCLDPKSQDNSIPHPHKYEGGGCRLGSPGHCLKCPWRGQDDPRWHFVKLLDMWASAAQRWKSRSELLEKMPEDIQAVLFPANELEWIKREDKWAERANYYAVTNNNALIQELLREIYDLQLS